MQSSHWVCRLKLEYYSILMHLFWPQYNSYIPVPSPLGRLAKLDLAYHNNRIHRRLEGALNLLLQASHPLPIWILQVPSERTWLREALPIPPDACADACIGRFSALPHLMPKQPSKVGYKSKPV